ncbi:FUSC family protein [Ruminococcus sp. OA3]|uniref:FUSC family protein n=1 Tax=Ruminococcus sp. OA3 TaxID=2914164 RepID=UPI001F06F092|nr:FUSC family protein [Ruminococcus sp. OA3]MCH1984361.1 FUSC family protein [Ruminococcus sp. OA3]
MSNNRIKIPDKIKRNFRSNTLNFIFVISYVNIFQFIFGAENSIVGVIFAIMMSASMIRDLTATPLRHLVVQALVMVWMALAACLVTVLTAPLAFMINFITLLMILYSFTFEYSSHMYFPYILSYLFLIFISPVSPQHLPKRLLGMLAGALSIILYQWFMGRKRVAETAKDMLSEMIDCIVQYISFRLKETGKIPDPADIHKKLSRLSQAVYDRRKKVLCISDASFSMIDAGRGLEHLLILMKELPDTSPVQTRAILLTIADYLELFRRFLQQEITELPSCKYSDFLAACDETTAGLFYHAVDDTRDRLLHMSDPQNKVRYRKTATSFKIRIQAAIDLSPVRAVYALRTAFLLSSATLLVHLLSLPHGRWLLFTLASVSLPYADDVSVKMKKRIAATVIGGLVSVLIYSLVPSPAGRTAVMMLSGYVSFYFDDYTETFACSTVGALGGAVFLNAVGFPAVGSVFIIRLGYILAGAAVAYTVNCLLFPYRRTMATRHLWKKYKHITTLLTETCLSDQVDTQLYYNLVIQAYLLETKLTQNAHLDEWSEFPSVLKSCQEQVFKAHRKFITARTDAPVFNPGHLS